MDEWTGGSMSVEQRAESQGAHGDSVRRDPATLPDRYDDMRYTPEELEAFPRVADMIKVATDETLPLYEQSDLTAGQRQRQHRTLTMFAAVGGTAAMLLSLIEVSELSGGRLPPWLELCLLLIALAAIILGLKAAAAPGWLLERHKAEHCRLQRYKFLIDPEIWSGDQARRDARIQKLHDDIGKIAAADQKKLEAWIETEAVPTMPTGWSPKIEQDGTLRDLVGYYRRNRLANQLGYFRKRKDSFSRRESILKVLPTVLFIASVGLALANSAYVYGVSLGYITPNFGLGKVAHAATLAADDQAKDIHAAADSGHHEPDTTNRLLTVTMASLAIIATGVRTVRGASEYGRNSSRYAAKYEMLHSVEEKLEGGGVTLAILPAFWHAEQSLEADHRDWLRLMREAEWFG
jgi:hypothetical protein